MFDGNLLKPGLYRHYKGGLYVVLGTAIDSTNQPDREGTPVVLYWSLKQNRLRCRLLSEFIAPTRWPSGDLYARFQKVAE